MLHIDQFALRPKTPHRRARAGMVRAAAIFIVSAMLFFGCNTAREGTGAETSPSPAAPDAFAGGTSTSHTFAEGTFIDGVDVSGMDESTASALLVTAADAKKDSYSCTLHVSDGESIEITPSDIPMDNGLEAVMDAALSGGAGSYDIRPVFNGSALDEWIRTLAQALYRAPAPYKLTVITDHEQALTEGRFKLEYGADGRELDSAGLKAIMLEGRTDIDVPVKTLKYADNANGTFAPDPSESTETELPELLGAFATEFGIWSESASNRAHNIEKAAGMINGCRVAPGKSFSCNITLGERSEENGWKPATAFVNGGLETEDQYGGGICQISSTMYNAVLRADLEVLKRSGHSRVVPYVPGGTDAAISGDTLDLIWQNNTDSDVYIFMWIENRTELHCELYGRRMSDEFDSIDVESVLKETIPAPIEPVFTNDPNLPYGACELAEKAAEGKVFETYKVYYKDETEVRREYVDKTEYRERPSVYAVGTAGGDGGDDGNIGNDGTDAGSPPA